MEYLGKFRLVGGYGIAIGALLGVAACSAPSAPQAAGGTGPGPRPLVYVSSLRAPSDVTTCLRGRLSRVHILRKGDATELDVGAGSRQENWLITLTPSGTGGTIVKVQQPSGGEGDPDEPEMRFHLARCIT